jgi:hypothetical protein
VGVRVGRVGREMRLPGWILWGARELEVELM